MNYNQIPGQPNTQAPVPQPMPYNPAQAPVPQPMPYNPAQAPVPQPMPYNPAQAPVPQPMPYNPVQAPTPQPMPYNPMQNTMPQQVYVQPQTGNYPYSPTGYQPYGTVYTLKYGYIEPDKLQKKIVRRDVNLMALVTLGMLAMSLVFGLIIGAFLGKGSVNLLSDDEFYYALSAASVILGTGLPFILYVLIAKPDITKLISFKKVGAGTAVLLALAGCGICLASNFPAQWIATFLENLGMESATSDLMTVQTPLAAVLMFFGVAVLPPVFEEFAFRGIVLSSLRKYGDVFALIVSSVMFGLMHMSLTSIPFAILAGIVMGFIYIKTGNLWVNIAVHALNNAIATIQSVSYSFMPEATADILNLALFYGFIAIGVVALIILAVTKKLNFKAEKPRMLISSGDKFMCAAVNPGFIGLFVICMGSAVMSAFGLSLL